ncbi:hypothetical protein BD626DRAFT_510563 [Schizophyllum amplum]|uniref:Uncharacterized protein n=1 Tax=Schizophyllum amplum TaxID=97359 RepID=A0A550C1W3_9AGAR|nr:hypothetical protein BD626DRAFT_510563 [Auriculariopsis ampla]
MTSRQRETIESGAVVITTSGSGEEGIVPQMFLEFRGMFGASSMSGASFGPTCSPSVLATPSASALYLSTSALSTANVSATISQGGTATYQNVTSSTGLIAIVGLEGAALSTLALTYIGPGRFDLSQMWLTVDDELATLTSSFLPSLSAPPSATLPVFTTGAPTIVASQPSVPQDNRSRNLAYPLGLTLGLGLGLTTLAACSYALWRRWRRRRKDRELEEAKEQEAWERRKGKLRADIVP